jgi:hypothetical protein
MNNLPASILKTVEERFGEEVTAKSYDVAFGMAGYFLLTAASGKKFTAACCEETAQIVAEDRDGNIYSKGVISAEEENIRRLAEAGIEVPAILCAGSNFIVWPYLGGNIPLDENILSGGGRLDEAVSGIIECLAAIHRLDVNILPQKVSCNRENLEFKKNYSFSAIIENSDDAIAGKIRGGTSYGRLCELFGSLSGINIEEGVVKGETYNPETIFLDGDKIHLTNYAFVGTGNSLFDIVCPVSWGLPSDTDEAILKKQQRVRHYLNAMNINEEQKVFCGVDYFTVLESINMMDTLSCRNDEKAKILFKAAHRNMGSLISGNAELNKAAEILSGLIKKMD